MNFKTRACGIGGGVEAGCETRDPIARAMVFALLADMIDKRMVD